MTRRRRDGQPTADQIPPTEGDEALAIDWAAGTEPRADEGAQAAEAVAERQAEATADSAPPTGAPAAEPALDGNSRYGQVKTDLDRLEVIREQRKLLNKEASEIIDRLEKESGVNRGALAEVRRMLDLSPAAIAAREESRKELFDWMIKPKLDEAAEAGSEG